MKVIKMVTMMFIKTTRILKILVVTIATMIKMTNMWGALWRWQRWPQQWRGWSWQTRGWSEDDLGTDQAAAGESGRTNNVCQPANSSHQMVPNIIIMMTTTTMMVAMLMIMISMRTNNMWEAANLPGNKYLPLSQQDILVVHVFRSSLEARDKRQEAAPISQDIWWRPMA